MSRMSSRDLPSAADQRLPADSDDVDEPLDGALWPPNQPRGQPSRTVAADIHIAYHALMRRIDRAGTDVGLSASEMFVLTAIAANPFVAITVIRGMTGLVPSTMSSLLRRLERDGLISRTQGGSDGRAVIVDVSARGQAAAQTAAAVLAEVEEELLGYVSRGRLEGLRWVADACQAVERDGRSGARWTG